MTRPALQLGPIPRAAWLPASALALVAIGALLRVLPVPPTWGRWVWEIGLVLTAAPVVWGTIRGAARGHFATDVVATLAILTAIVLRQPLAGLIVVLMQTGGEALERYAEGRASEAIRALEEAAPRLAHVLADDRVEDVAAADVRVGDVLLIRPGELVPCDGVVLDGRSHVDVSRLTGEPLPVSAAPGTHLMSGSLNGEGVLTMRATALARESQYERIVELVRTAQASKSPLQRLADRYAVWFTPLTLLVCVAAYAASRDPTRVLAVLVVATPCPLILATPIAIIGGVNRAARGRIIIRTGAALEQLGRVDTAVFDKTGTLTIGRPEVSRVVPADGVDEGELLELSAAVEQGSSHLLARAIVSAAEERGIAIPPAREHRESAGRGVVGQVNGNRVAIGSRGFVTQEHAIPSGAIDAHDADGAVAVAVGGADAAEPAANGSGAGLRAYVVVDGSFAGTIEFADRIRPEVHRLLERLPRLGIDRTLLLSGDEVSNAREVASALGIDEVHGDLLPEGKVGIVKRLVQSGERVLMVGDGTNDAPALSSATVGVALAAHGGGITAEAADVVVLADDVNRVGDAVAIGQRTMHIARQSIGVGLGLSGVAMLVAAAGYIPPVIGALLQEAIDVAVIVNALRASRGDVAA